MAPRSPDRVWDAPIFIPDRAAPLTRSALFPYVWLVLGAGVLSPVKEFITLQVAAPVTLSGMKAERQQCSEKSDEVNSDLLFKVNEVTEWKLMSVKLTWTNLKYVRICPILCFKHTLIYVQYITVHSLNNLQLILSNYTFFSCWFDSWEVAYRSHIFQL